MKASKSLILVISHNTPVSKWMPLELSYVDGHIRFCAIAPVSKDNQTLLDYQVSEYLSLYSCLNLQNDAIGNSQLWIKQIDTDYVILNSWVKNFLIPFKH